MDVVASLDLEGCCGDGEKGELTFVSFLCFLWALDPNLDPNLAVS